MAKKNKKKKNKFNFVSAEEVSIVVSNNVPEKCVINEDVITSEDAIIDVLPSKKESKSFNSDSFVDIVPTSEEDRIIRNKPVASIETFDVEQVEDDSNPTYDTSSPIEEEIPTEVVDVSAEKEIPTEEEVASEEESEEVEVEEIVEEEKETSPITEETPVEENSKEEDSSEEKIEKEDSTDETTTEEETKEESKLDRTRRFYMPDSSKIITTEEKVEDKSNFHFGFGKRIALLSSFIVILCIGLAFFVYQSLQMGSNETIQYEEKADILYSVCDNGSTGRINCSSENINYFTQVIKTIDAKFNYQADFDKVINNEVTYRIVALTKIMDETDSSKVLHKIEETLSSNTYQVDVEGKIKFSNSVDIDLEKYNKSVYDYMQKYNLNTTANLTVQLIMEGLDEPRTVRSFSLDLAKDSFQIVPDNSSNYHGEVKIKTTTWTDNNTFYAVLSVIMLLSIILLIYRIIRLFLMVRRTRNKYQVRLNYLLREYDRLIVIARDGYESNVHKKEVRLSNFEELLNARNALEKPIIFSKVNDVKSEFIVEDDEQLFKYVLKEADL